MGDKVCRCGVDDKFCAACYAAEREARQKAEAEVEELIERRVLLERGRWRTEAMERLEAELAKERGRLDWLVEFVLRNHPLAPTLQANPRAAIDAAMEGR